MVGILAACPDQRQQPAIVGTHQHENSEPGETEAAWGNKPAAPVTRQSCPVRGQPQAALYRPAALEGGSQPCQRECCAQHGNCHAAGDSGTQREQEQESTAGHRQVADRFSGQCDPRVDR